jgi:hypothetical protein
LLPPDKAELFLPEHFMHIEFQQGLSTSDMMTLWALGKRLMEFRSDWKPIEVVLIPKPITPIDCAGNQDAGCRTRDGLSLSRLLFLKPCFLRPS